MIVKPICHRCIIEEYLAKRIKKEGTVNNCILCSKAKKCLPLKEIVEEVQNLLDEHLELGEQCADFSEENTTYYQSGDDLNYWVAEFLECDSDAKVVSIICEELNEIAQYEAHDGGEGLYDSWNSFVAKPISLYFAEERWGEFKNDMRHGNRFFNGGAKSFLDWMFKDISELNVFGKSSKTVVYELNNISIYRARVYENSSTFLEISKNPTVELSAPPKDKAAAGRMNPAGIPAFYGAFNRATCVAELRPAVGSKVISGEFSITRPLRVLDFTILSDSHNPKSLSYFHSEYRETEERIQFLRSLHEKISIPILPNQQEEYLITQVIAEYIYTQLKPKIDGIIFSSAQVSNGKNIVIFSPTLGLLGTPYMEEDKNSNALTYIADSLILHQINKVSYKTTDKEVRDGELENSDDVYNDWDF